MHEIFCLLTRALNKKLFLTFGVVALGPVVAGAGLAEDKVVGTEELAEGPGADGVHGAGLEVDEDGAGHVLAAAGLIVVDVDALELEVGGADVGAGGVDAVLVGDDLPELGKERRKKGN